MEREFEFVLMATCRECGWHDRAEYCEDIEVMYPSHGVEPDWGNEKACPICGSTDLDMDWSEV